MTITPPTPPVLGCPAPGAVRSAGATLGSALLGFFVITLDAVIVNVALPSIGGALGGGMTGLQWVVDGYTLMFAALLLSAGSLSDRVGARRAFGAGLAVFVLSSLACGLAPTLGVLMVARFVQGSAAAVMMPASMALIGQAYPDRTRRGRAVAVWAMGGAVAACAGPVLGGALSVLDWRLIFFVNIPVGAVALLLLARTPASPRRLVPFDGVGQTSAVVAMGALTYGAIQAGAQGLTAPAVLASFTVTVVSLAVFLTAQARCAHPMLPLDLFRSRTVVIAVAVGFTFMVGYFGLPFVMSLYLQQLHGLSTPATGVVFLPMMLIGLVLTPFSAGIAERFGARVPIAGGLALMAVGLGDLAVMPATTPTWVLAMVMVLIGLAGPLVSPPVTAVLLGAVPEHRAGTASAVFNTSRQVGGALAVAVFGALLAGPAGFLPGMRVSLLLAAGLALLTALASLLLPTTIHHD